MDVQIRVEPAIAQAVMITSTVLVVTHTPFHRAFALLGSTLSDAILSIGGTSLSAIPNPNFAKVGVLAMAA